MTFPVIDPVFLRIGPLELRWYGLMYILAFTAAYFLIRHAVETRGIRLTRDDIGDLVFAVALGIILGGRIGYILFYNIGYYLENPLKLFAVWEGGMSFHGGFAGSLISGIIYCRKKKLNFLEIADVCFFTAPIGLMFGRIGNFINGELYGRVTDVPWGVIFPGGGFLPRHPSQLYESFLEGPVTLVLLWLIWHARRPAGTVLWGFIALYGLFRTFVECFREPDQQIGYIGGVFSMGQILSIPMFIAGCIMVLHLNRRKS